jgi:acetamidase/formamidase
MSTHHILGTEATVNRWNRDYPPALSIKPGDTVEVQMRDSSDGQVKPGMTGAEFAQIDRERIHAITGPIFVDGAKPGDVIKVEIGEYRHEGWAWTSIIPGLGLLGDEFSEPYLFTWELDGNVTRSFPGVTLDLHPFCGIIGLQRAEKGEFRTRPPGPFGGNLDVKHLTTGATLFLPVGVPGGGLCAGDCHAAQGDGEVSINGMEAPMTVTLKVDLLRKELLSGPRALVPGKLVSDRYASQPWEVFIESHENPREAAREVVRRAIQYLRERLGVSREEACILCSVVLDLKLSQVVNLPLTTVSGYLPLAIFN